MSQASSTVRPERVKDKAIVWVVDVNQGGMLTAGLDVFTPRQNRASHGMAPEV